MGEAAVTRTQEAIDKATKQNLKQLEMLRNTKEKLAKLQVDKERISYLHKGVKANSFDTRFFEGEKWTNLRTNATVGKKAEELMEQLAELERQACPTIDLVNEVLDVVDDS